MAEPVTASDPRCRCSHTRAEHAHGAGRCWPATVPAPGPAGDAGLRAPGKPCDCAAYAPAGLVPAAPAGGEEKEA